MTVRNRVRPMSLPFFMGADTARVNIVLSLSGSTLRKDKRLCTSSDRLMNGVPVKASLRCAFICWTALKYFVLLFRIVCCSKRTRKQ